MTKQGFLFVLSCLNIRRLIPLSFTDIYGPQRVTL
jgi:hypothetical protein